MTPLERLIIIRNNILIAIETISANPKPNYSIEGQSVSHVELLRLLLDSLKTIEEAIVMYDPYMKMSVVP